MLVSEITLTATKLSPKTNSITIGWTAIAHESVTYSVRAVPDYTSCMQDEIPTIVTTNDATVEVSGLTPGVKYGLSLSISLTSASFYPTKTLNISLPDVYTRELHLQNGLFIRLCINLSGR